MRGSSGWDEIGECGELKTWRTLKKDLDVR